MTERDALYEKPEMSNEDGMRLGELEGIVGEEDGYSAESDAAVLLQGLDIPDALHERKMGELQGGQKMRVLLAQALFGHPDALLLDEPTNHLDLDSIHWLEEFLNRYDGTLIVISHDRHFLNRVCTHIADIDYRTIITYTGGYDDMVMAKTQIRSKIESRERAAREEDRAAQRLHRPLRRRHARQPDDVAPQGSRAAADDRAGAIEHPAAVHQVHDEAAVRQGAARVRGTVEGVRPACRRARLQRGRQSRRQDRPRRPQRRRQDDAAQGDAGRRAGHAGVTRRSRRGQSALGPRGRRSATSRRTTPARSRKG